MYSQEAIICEIDKYSFDQIVGVSSIILHLKNDMLFLIVTHTFDFIFCLELAVPLLKAGFWLSS